MQPGALSRDPDAAGPQVRAWFADLVGDRRLAPKSRRVAHYIEANPSVAAFKSLTEVAEATDVNAATVVRFAQALGFKGWPSFQLELRHRCLSNLMHSDVMRRQGLEGAPTAAEATIRRDIENLHTVLETIDAAEVEAIARLIAGARRTVVISSGSWASVGMVLAHLGSFMGYPITLETRGGHHLAVTLSSLDERDLVIGISFWRLVKDLVRAMEAAQRRGIPTVAITDSPLSSLARGATHTLITPTDSVSFFQSVTAATAVAYGLLATLQAVGGPAADQQVVRTQELFGELDVLHA